MLLKGRKSRPNNKNSFLILNNLQIIRAVKSKAVPLHAMMALGGEGIAPTHS
jgi:hypothetical protein